MARRPVSQGGTLVLDSEGLSKLASNDERAVVLVEKANRRNMKVTISTVTLTEVLRGGPRDAAVNRTLKKIIKVDVTPSLAQAAGELLGCTGLSGHRCAIDAIVAATALTSPGPTVILTSDPNDMSKLVEEPGRPRDERIVVIHI